MASIWHKRVEPERGKPVTPTKFGVIFIAFGPSFCTVL
jgi:dipeptide/tripeptide permease